MGYNLNVDTNNKLVKLFIKLATRFDYDAYWKMRSCIIDSQNKTPQIIKLFYLFKIKRCDSLHNSSFGTDLNKGASFASRPILMHGPNGIIISHYAKFGNHVYICQRVTIAQALHSNDAPQIGDNVFLGAGCVVVGGVTIGEGAVIGANAVVTSNIPAGATAVGVPARVVKEKNVDV